jgi:hypothetical protein
VLHPPFLLSWHPYFLLSLHLSVDVRIAIELDNFIGDGVVLGVLCVCQAALCIVVEPG